MRVALAGLQKELMEEVIKKHSGDRVATILTTDMEAVTMLQSGQADYYFGACNTGAGAAISIPIALLGYNSCCTVAKPGVGASVAEVSQFVDEGKIAFGISIENIEQAIPILLNKLLD